MPKPSSSLASVSLYTWGTHHPGGNGVSHYLDSVFFGGNVGHASLDITIPANKEGRELIQKYCYQNDQRILPFERISQTVLDDHNQPIKQDFFVVHFSWFPRDEDAPEGAGFTLTSSLNEDRADERIGVGVDPLDPRFGIELEQRTYRGLLGSRKMALTYEQIAHTQTLSEMQKACLEATRQLVVMNNNLQAISIINKYLDKPQVKIEGTLQSLLEKHHINWREMIPYAKNPTPEQIVQLKERVQQKEEEYTKAELALEEEVDKHKTPLLLLEAQKLRDDLEPVVAQSNFIRNFEVFTQRINQFNNPEQRAIIHSILFDKKLPKPLPKELKDHLDQGEFNLAALKDWRQYLPEAQRQVTRDQFTHEIFDHLIEQVGRVKENFEQQRRERTGNLSEQHWLTFEMMEASKSAEAHLALLQLMKKGLKGDKQKLLNILFIPDKKQNIFTKSWRQFLPPGHAHIEREQMTEEMIIILINNIQEKHTALQKYHDQLNKENELVFMKGSFFQRDHELFVTTGLNPDHRISLPVSGITENQYDKPGLNVEKMLQKMCEIANEGEIFSLFNNNCSSTTGAIMAAGAGQEFHSTLSRKALGGFGTPQEVLNGAVEYQDILIRNNGKRSVWGKLAEYNPLNIGRWLGGKVLKKLADPDTSTAMKVTLGILALPPATLLAATTETVKAVFNPRKTFTNCISFVQYAWRNNSTFLKVCSVPAGLMAGIMAIPATIQHGIDRGIVAPLKNLFKKRTREDRPQIDPALKLDPDETEEIATLDPKEAIDDMEASLAHNPLMVPVLSPAAQTRVESYLSGVDINDDKSKKYQRIVEKVHARVNYKAYRKRLSLAQEKFGADAFEILSETEYQIKPDLNSNYAAQLQLDINEGNIPTSLKEFTEAHELAVIETGNQRPLLSAYHLRHVKAGAVTGAPEVQPEPAPAEPSPDKPAGPDQP